MFELVERITLDINEDAARGLAAGGQPLGVTQPRTPEETTLVLGVAFSAVRPGSDNTLARRLLRGLTVPEDVPEDAESVHALACWALRQPAPAPPTASKASSSWLTPAEAIGLAVRWLTTDSIEGRRQALLILDRIATISDDQANTLEVLRELPQATPDVERACNLLPQRPAFGDASLLYLRAAITLRYSIN